MDYSTCLEELKKEFPEFVVIEKESSGFMRVLDRALRILSFGRADKFMTSYTTTIGYKVYVPKDWESKKEASRVTTLMHEAVHMRQANRYGRFLFSLMYLFLPFPVFFAYFRMRFEMEAYETTMQLDVSRFGWQNCTHDLYVNSLVSKFTGPDYIFTWIYRPTVERWARDYLETLKPSK